MNIGVVCENFEDVADLLESFALALDLLAESHPNPDRARRLAARARKVDPDYPDTDSQVTETLEDLNEALNESAPAYTRFALEGDSWGFWPDFDLIREGIYSGEILGVEDSRHANNRVRPYFVYDVNDHGNATLYRVTYEEVWAIV